VDKFSPDPTLPRDGTVLFVGRLLPHKGIDDLIMQFRRRYPSKSSDNLMILIFFASFRKLAAGKRVTFRHNCDDAALVMPIGEPYASCYRAYTDEVRP